MKPSAARCLPILRAGILLLALTPGAPAQLPADVNGRFQAIETIMDRYYRGESLDAARRRVDALVEGLNARIDQRNQALAALEGQAAKDQAPAQELEKAVEASDKALGAPPDPSDREAVRRYNARVDAHNALVAKYNAALEAARASGDSGRASLQALDASLQRERAQVESERRKLKARQADYDGFCDQGRDMVFFTALNRLLADLREGCRRRPDPSLLQALGRARALRLELARWAQARQAAQDNGLVLVEAKVGDEPCCFIVDTGAQLVCLPEELVDALGLGTALGEASTLSLAGGQKTRGRSITWPSVEVAGRRAEAVAGAAVPASEVGIDGLLGQSFLRRFVTTLDASADAKLLLQPR